MTAAGPIGTGERDRLFAGLTLPLAVAVSGGPDSMALMHLVAGWAGTRRGHGLPGGVAPVVALTVDHGLRPASAGEARWVAEEAARLGLAHAILEWRGTKPATGIQEAAREARFRLLLDQVGGEELARPRDILLAHHQDDQAETLLMRLARGSAIDGLSAMREAEQRTWLRLGHPVEERRVVLRRPLLELPKARLVATLQALGGRWLEDPSNREARFERARLRSLRAGYEALGLANDRLATSARRLAAARTALEAAQYGLARSCLRLHHDGAWATLEIDCLLGAPRELRLRVLGSVVRAFGGQREAAERPKLERLAEGLGAGAGSVTLGGALLEPAPVGPGGSASAGRLLRVHREPGRRGLPSHRLRPGQGLFWDRRFYVSLSPAAHRALEVRGLGEAPYAALARRHPAVAALGLPRRAGATLPAVWDGEDLVAVPSLAGAAAALGGPRAGPEPAVLARFADQHVRAMLGEDAASERVAGG